jgi:hypothetical protein
MFAQVLKLKHLDIQKCPEMTDDVMKHVCKSKKLNVLRLLWNSHLLGTNFLLSPSNLVHLTELHVHGCFHWMKNIWTNLRKKCHI